MKRRVIYMYDTLIAVSDSGSTLFLTSHIVTRANKYAIMITSLKRLLWLSSVLFLVLLNMYNEHLQSTDPVKPLISAAARWSIRCLDARSLDAVSDRLVDVTLSWFLVIHLVICRCLLTVCLSVCLSVSRSYAVPRSVISMEYWRSPRSVMLEHSYTSLKLLSDLKFANCRIL